MTFSFPLDAEDFLAEGLRNENLSAGAQDQRDHILRGFQQIKSRFVSASLIMLFQEKSPLPQYKLTVTCTCHRFSDLAEIYKLIWK